MARDHRGYLQRVSALYNVWGMLPSTYQAAAVAAVSALAGVFGFKAGGIFYAILGASFVFAAGMIGLFFMLLVMRNMNVFNKLLVQSIGLQGFMIETQGNFLKSISGVTMNCILHNSSARDIHFKVLRAHVTIMNQVNQDAKINEMINIVPGGQPQLLMFATIDEVKFAPKLDLSRPSKSSPMKGYIEIEIKYGPTDQMPYLLSYAAELGFAISASHQTKGKWSVTLQPTAMIRRLQHKEAPYG